MAEKVAGLDEQPQKLASETSITAGQGSPHEHAGDIKNESEAAEATASDAGDGLTSVSSGLEANASPPTQPASSPPSPPNGGTRAWLQVLGSFCLYFNTWGVIASYGTFQAIYENGALSSHSPFEISVIGSLQTFLMVSLGLIVGPVYDAGYFRHLLVLGCTLIFAGLLLQSFCDAYWQFLLAQGVLVGLGAGCLSLLAVIVPSLWFNTRLPIANGLAASGSGLGGVVLPIMIREVNYRASLGWAARSMAFLCVFLGALAILVLRVPDPSAARRTPRSLIDPTALRDWPFVLFVFGCFTVFLGMYTPFVHIQAYALRESITSPSFALYILAILNSSSILGRVLPSLVAQHIGSMNMIICTCIALAVTSFCLMTTGSSLARLLSAAIVYGFFTGTFFALQPTIFWRLSADPRMVGTRFGMAFVVLSIALLFGPPISGALLDHKGYNAAWIWCGVTILAGGGLILTSRIKKAGLDVKRAI